MSEIISNMTQLRPLMLNEFRAELCDNLILDKVGMGIARTVRGIPVYPVIGGTTASIVRQDVELEPTLTNITVKLAESKDVFTQIRITGGAIRISGYDIHAEAAKELGRSVSRLLNKWLLSPTLIAGEAAVGPFVKDPVIDANQIVKFAAAVPTFEEIVSLETKVVNANIYDPSKGMYLVSPSTAKILKLTPIKDGDRMILENNQINGYPVGITNTVPEGVVEFGIFSYAVLNEFAEPDFVFDPYTNADKDMYIYSLQGEYDITTLNAEAFTIGVTPIAYAEVYQ